MMNNDAQKIYITIYQNVIVCFQNLQKYFVPFFVPFCCWQEILL